MSRVSKRTFAGAWPTVGPKKEHWMKRCEAVWRNSGKAAGSRCKNPATHHLVLATEFRRFCLLCCQSWQDRSQGGGVPVLGVLPMRGGSENAEMIKALQVRYALTKRQ